MKFRIRSPFSVHLEKFNDGVRAGKAIKTPIVESHFEGEVVDLNEADSNRHLHKLEPLDDAAKAHADVAIARTETVAASRASVPGAGPTPAEIERLIDARVAKALSVQQQATATKR